MRRIRSAAFLILALVLTPVAGPAQDLPLFDAHIHYNQQDWAVYSPEAARAFGSPRKKVRDRTGVAS